MLRKLSIVGLGVPLAAFIGVMAYLLLFGISEPTFDAATRELAREHTVLRIRDEPPAALVVPTEPIVAVVLVVVLPDNDRHVWSALRSLGLLDYVDSYGLALLPATGAPDRDQLAELVALAAGFVALDGVYLAAFAGTTLAAVCRDDVPRQAWSGVVVVDAARSAALGGCGDAPMLRMEGLDDLGERMVRWMLETP